MIFKIFYLSSNERIDADDIIFLPLFNYFFLLIKSVVINCKVIFLPFLTNTFVFSILLIVSFLIPFSLSAQQKIWTSLSQDILPKDEMNHYSSFELFQLNADLFLETTDKIGKEFSKQPVTFLSFPMPNGKLTAFKITRSSVLQAGLSNKFPSFQCFKIVAKENPFLQGRISWTKKGFYAHLMEEGHSIFIEPIPIEGKQEVYIVYWGEDQNIERKQDLICGNNLFKNSSKQLASLTEQKGVNNTDLKIFRLAITTTQQFTNATGGTIETALSSIINTLTSLNVIYERDLAIRFLLHEENDRLIFTEENPAPFSDSENAFGLWAEHPFILDSLIGINSYDIGHVFATDCTGGVAGLAYLGSVCSANKASGVSCLMDESIAELRRTLYHEIGHQLGANHTWSNCGESANEDQRHASTAMEPGGGSTIMSYGGVCGPYDIVNTSQDNLHGVSIQEIKETLARDSITCFEQIPLENTNPFVAIRKDSFFIPILTPFELKADAFDEENTSLTYSWEQFDTGVVSEVGFPLGNAPSFRAFLPTRDPVRVFPRIIDIILNRTSIIEVLPDTSRSLTFGVTVRDNNGEGGGISFAKVAFFASKKSGPFLIKSPDSTNIIYEEGDSIDVLWDVAGTNRFPVKCSLVDVYLSFDNGQKFPMLLAKQIPNNGATRVVLPDTTSNRARVKVKCSDNIFFDISNNRFKIIERVTTPINNLFEEKIKLYPNPAKNGIFLKLPETLPKIINITICDALGKTILNKEMITTDGLLYLNTSYLRPSIYFLKGKINEQIFSKKIIIQK